MAVGRVYWYAPFDNAGEMALAAELGGRGCVDLTVQSVTGRLGDLLPSEAMSFHLIRDLPPPAGERGERRTRRRRLTVAAERAIRRQRVVARGRFDIAHLHTFNVHTDWLAVRRLRRRAPRVILSIHNVVPHERELPAALEQRLLRMGYVAGDTLTVADEWLKGFLCERFGIPRARVHVVPFPVTLPLQLEPVPQEAEPVTLLFFGTFRRNKGIEVLAEAATLLRRDPPDRTYRIVIAGRGERDLEHLVAGEAKEHPEVVAHIGHATDDERRSLYGAAQSVLLPYIEFGAQSGVLFDAYASGLPVVASDLGALGASVARHGSGWLVEVGDAASLARTLREVIEAGPERTRRGLRGLEVARRASTPNVVDALLELYEDIARDVVRTG